MKDIAVLSLVSAALSFLISEARVTAPLRMRFSGLRGLLTCGYCLGHWISLALAVGFGVKLFGSYILATLVMAWLSGFQWAIMRRLID